MASVSHAVLVPASNDRAPARARGSLGLRTKVTIYFSIAGLLLSLGLSALTFVVSRNFLISQRRSSAEKQAYSNAAYVRDSLDRPGVEPKSLIGEVPTEGSGLAFLHLETTDKWFPRKNVGSFVTDLPEELRDRVLAGQPAGRQYFTYKGERYLVMGVGIAAFNAHYFEMFPLDTVERTLRVIGTSLAIAALATTLAAAGVGWWASRRLLRPVARVADAAAELASGSLNIRLPLESDPDLDRLANSFNDMADAIQARIQRETRFASDVSHELRSPITALTAGVEVLDARRAEMPERAQQALDVVVNQVRRFDQLVLDLLELSRLDAGSTDLHREELVLSDIVSRVAKRYGFEDVPMSVSAGGHRPIQVDKRRLERIVANLLDNARQHGGGPVRIHIESGTDEGGAILKLAVEDSGPGVAMSERTRIFERFARGTAARQRIGTGLGLALVAEHARAHGGEAWVEDRPGGGARFVVSFPVVAR